VIDRVLTWWTIFRVGVDERLVYRADFMLGTLMRFLPIVTQILLWTAIFAAAPTTDIGGLNRDQFIAYYLLVMISRAFSSMPGLTAGITNQIRNGEIKKFLIQPIDLIGFLLLTRIAHKLVYYILAAAPFALVFYLCRGYFDGWPSAHVMFAYILSLFMAFAIGFFLEVFLGMIGFWWLEVSSLLFIYMMFNYFLSGHMFPLDILPPHVRMMVDYLPFQYVAYFPAAVFLGLVEGKEMVQGLWIQFGWVVVFFVLARVTFSLGIRRYSGFGG